MNPNEALLERLAIRERIDEYVNLINHRDWDAYEDLWTEDMEWSVSEPVSLRVVGRDNMMQFLRTSQQYGFGFVFQMPHGVVVELLGPRRAKARHTLHVVTSTFTDIGIYYDELVKGEDDRWRFSRRDFLITYHEAGDVPGTVHRRLPDPAYRCLPTSHGGPS